MSGPVVNGAGRTSLLPLLVALLFVAAPDRDVRAELHFSYDGRFSSEERIKLQTWITDVHAGVESLVGQFPFDVDIRFKRTRSSQPVPWANTRRGRRQGITFNVDPSFSLDELKADWTAAHELSHLIFPFVGQRNSWFSEGFASFMQYQVMHEMGEISADEARRRYLAKLDRSSARYRYPDRRFVETTPRLRAERKYPVMYWGGSVLFFRLEERLQDQTGAGFISLLSTYLECCRTGRDELETLARDLDRILGEPIVSGEIRKFRAEVGFPSYDSIAIGIVPKAN